MNEIRLFVFDLAGTTIQDKGEVPEAFTSALSAHGIDIPPDAIRGVRGASKREAIIHFITTSCPMSRNETSRMSDVIYEDFNSRLMTLFSERGVSVISGAVEAIRWLRRQRIKTALTTGFDRLITKTVLEILNWNDGLFDAIVCGNDVPRGRPAPFMIFRAMEAADVWGVHQVAVAGDTVLDLQAGWNAGVHWNIAVLSGAHNREQLLREHHTHLIPSVAEISSL